MSASEFPYYFRESDRLVKIGKKRNGDGTYKHPVPKDNFDQIMSTLVGFTRSGMRFETKRLQNQCDRIPRHQPLIVLAVLEEQGLVDNRGRGHWTFADRTGFSVASELVWENIPEG